MDPISAVFTAIQIAKAIHGQLEQLKTNRKDCTDLASRITALLGAIEACKENTIWINTNTALLNRLVTDLNEAQEFITNLENNFQSSQESGKGFTKKQRLGQAKAFFGATNDAASIQRLNERISQHVADLQVGSTAAVLQQTTAGFGEVNNKLDRMDALLGALQSMLIAGQVGAAMGNSTNMNNNIHNGNMNVQPSSPQQLQQQQQQYQNSNIGPTETVIGIEGSSSSSTTTNPKLNGGSISSSSPKIGRALEVAAHQFVFGSFMAGLACVYPGTWYRASILLFSPLIPAGFMAIVYIAVALQTYKKMRANWLLTLQRQHDQGLSIDDTSGGPQLSSLLSSIAAQLLIPLQLYSTPTLGGLAALAGEAYFNTTEGTGNVSDYHVALVGVGVGTIIFALSYLANAR